MAVGYADASDRVAGREEMDFSDERWAGLSGGYRVACDPRPALQMLWSHPDHKAAWEELWNELHHQGDIGEASYASVPALVELVKRNEARDWNPFALAALIEECRLEPRNPPLPDWLSDGYRQAWTQLFALALAKLADATDETLLNSLMAVVATHKGLPMLARLAILSESERRDMLDEAGWA